MIDEDKGGRESYAGIRNIYVCIQADSLVNCDKSYHFLSWNWREKVVQNGLHTLDHILRCVLSFQVEMYLLLIILFKVKHILAQKFCMKTWFKMYFNFVKLWERQERFMSIFCIPCLSYDVFYKLKLKYFLNSSGFDHVIREFFFFFYTFLREFDVHKKKKK